MPNAVRLWVIFEIYFGSKIIGAAQRTQQRAVRTELEPKAFWRGQKKVLADLVRAQKSQKYFKMAPKYFKNVSKSQKIISKDNLKKTHLWGIL